MKRCPRNCAIHSSRQSSPLLSDRPVKAKCYNYKEKWVMYTQRWFCHSSSFSFKTTQPYLTSRHAVDNDMVIHQVIHHHQLISQVCFVAVSYSHCIPYILVYIKISKVRLHVFRFNYFHQIR